jgi:transcriptional regulator with XRE-family HTH domain
MPRQLKQPSLGEAIRRAREAKGMSLRQLATAVGVSAPFLSDLEHGRRSTTRLPDIARVLGISIVDLDALSAKVDRELKAWIEANPALVSLLRESKRTRRPLILR